MSRSFTSQPLLKVLKELAFRDAKAAIVESVELFLFQPSTTLTFQPASESWESHLDRTGNARLVIRTNSPSGLKVNAKTGEISLIDGTGAPTLSKRMSIKPNVGTVPLADKVRELKWFVVEHVAGVTQWTFLETSDELMNIMQSSFEKALTIEGPFPLPFVCNYLNLAQYKSYEAPALVESQATLRNTFRPRDFAIGCVNYLESLAKGLNQNLTADRDSIYGYNVSISSRLSLLKCEQSDTVIQHNEHLNHESPKLSRTY